MGTIHRLALPGMLALIAAATTTAAAGAGAPVPPLPPVRPATLLPDAPLPDVPLPPVRPHELPPATPATPPVPGPAASAPPVSAPAATPAPSGAVPLAQEMVCLRLFNGGHVVARALEPIAGSNGCGIAAPIELSAIIASPTQRVGIEPPVTIGCPLAEAVADWVREDLVPAFATAGSGLAALSGTSGYACRGRNGIAGAKLSEHGRGNAMDIGAFVTADRKSFGVKQPGVGLLGAIKATACARFATVLGPGSDGFHESHMHVDVEQRRNGYTICHWDQPGAAVNQGPR